MPFRVIKFCKHSPGGSTVISNLFLLLSPFFPTSHLPPQLTHLLTDIHFLLFQHLLTLHVIRPSLFSHPALSSLRSCFHFFRLPLLCCHLSLWSFLICAVHANSCVWSCCWGRGSLVDFCFIKPIPALTDSSLDPLPFFISSHCTNILLLAFPLAHVCHHLLAPSPVTSSPFGGQMSPLPLPPQSFHQSPSSDAEDHMLVDHMCI